jgi:hypothetical protein
LLKGVVDPKGEHKGKNCQADEIKENGVVHRASCKIKGNKLSM